MHIDVAIKQLKGIFFFENYRENGFAYAIIIATSVALEMKIKPFFFIWKTWYLMIFTLSIRLSHRMLDNDLRVKLCT